MGPVSEPNVPELRGEEAAAFVRAQGLGDLAALFAEEEGEWCNGCKREHQRRDRPVECDHPGCSVLTDGYHRLCPEHRP